MAPQPEESTVQKVKEQTVLIPALVDFFEACDVFARSHSLTSTTDRLLVKEKPAPVDLVVSYTLTSEVEYEELDFARLAPPDLATHQTLREGGVYGALFGRADLYMGGTDAHVSLEVNTIYVSLGEAVEQSPLSYDERSVLGVLLFAPEAAFQYLAQHSADEAVAIVMAREKELGQVGLGFLGTRPEIEIESVWKFDAAARLVQYPVDKYLYEFEPETDSLPLVFLKGHGPA